jgi:hypothetical protein
MWASVALPMNALAHDSLLLRDALRGLGAGDDLCARLVSFLAARHPGEQGRLYHDLEHSLEVADLTARCVGALRPPLSRGRRALLVLAAALHDIDPLRAPGTPPRVAATLEHLFSDPEALRLVGDFGAHFGFTRGQAATMILATDHDAEPDRLAVKRALFRAAARGAFPEEPEALEWGRALAYWDKTASYVASPERARRRVAALARELRAAAGGRGPSASALLAGSPRFLAALRRDPLFATLSVVDRARFDTAAARLAA